MARIVSVRLVLQLALVCLDTGRLREEEAVVGGDDDVVAIQIVDDVADQRRQFVDRPAHRLEGMSFGLAVVADRIDGVVVDVDDPLILDELPALVLLLRHQLVALAGHPAHGLQNAVPFAGDAGLAVHQHVGPLVGQRLVRQQARHAQRRVRRQHAKLRRQRGLEAVLAIEFGGEFLSRFVAEGIADDDEGSPVLALVQPGPHVAVVETVLVRHLVDLPLGQQPVLRLDELAPSQRQSGQIPVDVMGLDVGSQRLDDVPALGFRAVCRLAEVAIELVEAVKLRLVGPVHRRRRRDSRSRSCAGSAGRRNPPPPRVRRKRHGAPCVGHPGNRPP